MYRRFGVRILQRPISIKKGIKLLTLSSRFIWSLDAAFTLAYVAVVIGLPTLRISNQTLRSPSTKTHISSETQPVQSEVNTASKTSDCITVVIFNFVWLLCIKRISDISVHCAKQVTELYESQIGDLRGFGTLWTVYDEVCICCTVLSHERSVDRGSDILYILRCTVPPRYD